MKVLSVTSTFVDFHFLSGAVFLGRNTLVIGDILWSHNVARWGHFLVQLKKKGGFLLLCLPVPNPSLQFQTPFLFKPCLKGSCVDVGL